MKNTRLDYHRLACNIITRRRSRHITQAGLARRAGCSVSAISRLGRAVHQPSVEMLFKVAAGLGSRASELVEGV